MDGGCTHGAEKAHGTAPGTAADSSRAKLQTGGRECRIKTLPYKVISGRIKTNCNMRFGCCHNGGRFRPHESEGDFFFEKPSLYAFVKEGDMYERF